MNSFFLNLNLVQYFLWNTTYIVLFVTRLYRKLWESNTKSLCTFRKIRKNAVFWTVDVFLRSILGIWYCEMFLRYHCTAVIGKLRVTQSLRMIRTWTKNFSHLPDCCIDVISSMQLPAANDTQVFVSLNIFEDIKLISHLFCNLPSINYDYSRFPGKN
jgi:hypothetical protein